MCVHARARACVCVQAMNVTRCQEQMQCGIYGWGKNGKFLTCPSSK